MARGQQAAVAAGHPETAEAARIILEEGGNAFDAALAALCASAIAEPVLSSLGGGGFLLACVAGERPRLYDFFAHTPHRRLSASAADFFPITADFGSTQQEFHIGMGSIAVPGTVRGLFDIHDDLGRMPLTRIVEPAIQLAKRGVRINRLQAYIFQVVAPIYLSNGPCREIFGRDSDRSVLKGEGETVASPDYADALDALAREGARLFYEGEMAARAVADCRQRGGHLSAEDFKHYATERRAALHIDHGNATLVTNPPPSSGGILVAFALELLRSRDVSRLGFGSAAHLGHLARVMALTNQVREEAELHTCETDQITETLLDSALLARYRKAAQTHPPSTRGTTHISIIDNAGNAAALTVSNGEGSGYIIPGTGIMLNNMLGEEDINPSGFHHWPTNTRMTSMMAPSVIFDRDGQTIALGSGGSNRIRSALLQVISNLLDSAMDLEQAVASPRIHYENGVLNVEPGFQPEAVSALSAAYPETRTFDHINLFFGGVHSAARNGKGHYHGAGDPRRGGVALVF